METIITRGSMTINRIKPNRERGDGEIDTDSLREREEIDRQIQIEREEIDR